MKHVELSSLIMDTYWSLPILVVDVEIYDTHWNSSCMQRGTILMVNVAANGTAHTFAFNRLDTDCENKKDKKRILSNQDLWAALINDVIAVSLLQ